MINQFPSDTHNLITTIWRCWNCPKDVKVHEPYDSGRISQITIFVDYNKQKYALFWRPKINILKISNIGSFYNGRILKCPDNYMPNVITPENAYDKLLLFLTFS
jgi:hypothetical protein